MAILHLIRCYIASVVETMLLNSLRTKKY